VGAWSPSLDEDLEPVTGVERVGLTCACGAGETWVFQGTQPGILIRNRRFSLTVRLDYDLTP
jgi:hypothetical protein